MNLIAVAKKGKAQMSIANQTLTLGENQLLICPPNTIVTDMMFSSDFEFKAFFFSNRIIQSFLRDKVSIWNETLYVYKMHVVTLIPKDIEFTFSLYTALYLIIDAPAERAIYRTECVQQLLSCAILALCGILKEMMPEQEGVERSQSANIFQQFLSLVNASKSKSRTVEDYAAELCISPKYLSVICKKASGKTANEWIRDHMLEEIDYYLKHTDLSVKQISNELDFSNPSFFGKYVKEHFGMTPLEYRQK